MKLLKTITMMAGLSAGLLAVAPAQAAKYEVHVTSNLGGAWTLLPNALVLENGALKIVDPAAGGAGLRLYKLVETP